MSNAVLAYLDPGTGSLILQLLVGGVAGAAVTVRLWWSKVTSLFKRRPTEQQNNPETS